MPGAAGPAQRAKPHLRNSLFLLWVSFPGGEATVQPPKALDEASPAFTPSTLLPSPVVRYSRTWWAAQGRQATS